MVGKLSALYTLALLAHVCLGQNAQSQVDLNLQGSASLGNRNNPDLSNGLTNGIRFLQNGATDIGNRLNAQGQQIQDITNNLAVSAQRLKSHVTEQLDKILQNLKEKAADAANAASKHIDDAVKAASQAVDKAKEKAIELGQDISECTKDNVNLEEIRARGKDLVTGCVNEKIQQAVDLVNRIKSETNDAIDTAQNLDASLALYCRGLNMLTSQRCRAIASNSAVNLSKNAVQVLSVIGEAANMISSIELELKTCVTKRAVQAATDAGNIALKVADCVKDKLIPDNSSVNTSGQEVSP